MKNAKKIAIHILELCASSSAPGLSRPLTTYAVNRKLGLKHMNPAHVMAFSRVMRADFGTTDHSQREVYARAAADLRDEYP